MPTTLLVLVNAVINAFRTVDHIIVMTRGGPDNATALLLYYIYEVGFKYWDSTYAAALTMVNHDYMKPLFHSSTGRMLLFVSVLMTAVGALILRKMVAFRA